jgi:hypothetical protein
MLLNSIAYFQDLHLSFVRFNVSGLLWSATAISRTDDLVLISYFQPLGGVFLRGAFQKLYRQWVRGLLASMDTGLLIVCSVIMKGNLSIKIYIAHCSYSPAS